MKRLLIVEDDPRLGPIMRDVLRSEWDAELVESAEAALTALTRAPYDVLIVDRGLPGLPGEALVRELRRTGNAVPVLILTALGEVHDRVLGLDAGANDYLVKPFDFAELSARLRALTRSFTRPDAGIEIGEWVLYEAELRVVSPFAGSIALTETETALIAALAAAPERVFSRDALLRAVSAQGESEVTVDTYVHYLRKKTERDIIRTVRGRGYQIGLRGSP